MRLRSRAPARGLPRLAVSGAGCLLMVATLSGCGGQDGDSDDPGSATDSSSESSSETAPAETPSTPSSGAAGQLVIGKTVEPGQAVIVSASNVTEQTSTRASALVDDESIEKFLAPVDPRLAEAVRAEIDATRVPADSTLFAVVASVGCDVPTGISWTTTFEGIEASATLPKSDKQCLVPVTSVALFLVPD